MCFSGTSYYTCGHHDTLTTPCEVSQSADVAFFNPLRCPNYNAETRRVLGKCGAGGWYCRLDPDGPYFDNAAKQLADMHATTARLQSLLAQQMSNMQIFKRNAHDRGVPEERFDASPQMQLLYAGIARIIDARSQVIAQAEAARNILRQGREHRFKNPSKSLSPAATPFVPTSPRLQADLLDPSSFLSLVTRSDRDGHETTIPSGHLPSAKASSMLGPHERSRPNAGSEAIEKDQVGGMDKPQANTTNGNNVTRTELARDDLAMEPPGALKTTGHKRRRDSISMPHTSRSASRPSDGVRRSTRVRNRKISYAESSGSDRTSREASVDQSNVSDLFSELSELSGSVSPTKNHSAKRRRVATAHTAVNSTSHRSLSEITGEWERGSDRKAAGAMPSTLIASQRLTPHTTKPLDVSPAKVCKSSLSETSALSPATELAKQGPATSTTMPTLTAPVIPATSTGANMSGPYSLPSIMQDQPHPSVQLNAVDTFLAPPLISASQDSSMNVIRRSFASTPFNQHFLPRQCIQAPRVSESFYGIQVPSGSSQDQSYLSYTSSFASPSLEPSVAFLPHHTLGIDPFVGMDPTMRPAYPAPATAVDRKDSATGYSSSPQLLHQPISKPQKRTLASPFIPPAKRARPTRLGQSLSPESPGENWTLANCFSSTTAATSDACPTVIKQGFDLPLSSLMKSPDQSNHSAAEVEDQKWGFAVDENKDVANARGGAPVEEEDEQWNTFAKWFAAEDSTQQGQV